MFGQLHFGPICTMRSSELRCQPFWYGLGELCAATTAEEVTGRIRGRTHGAGVGGDCAVDGSDTLCGDCASRRAVGCRCDPSQAIGWQPLDALDLLLHLDERLLHLVHRLGDLLPYLARSFLEIPDALAQTPGDIRQLPGAHYNQRDDQDKDEMGWLKETFKHDSAPFLTRQKAMGICAPPCRGSPLLSLI